MCKLIYHVGSCGHPQSTVTEPCGSHITLPSGDFCARLPFTEIGLAQDQKLNLRHDHRTPCRFCTDHTVIHGNLVENAPTPYTYGFRLAKEILETLACDERDLERIGLRYWSLHPSCHARAASTLVQYLSLTTEQKQFEDLRAVMETGVMDAVSWRQSAMDHWWVCFRNAYDMATYANEQMEENQEKKLSELLREQMSRTENDQLNAAVGYQAQRSLGAAIGEVKEAHEKVLALERVVDRLEEWYERRGKLEWSPEDTEDEIKQRMAWKNELAEELGHGQDLWEFLGWSMEE